MTKNINEYSEIKEFDFGIEFIYPIHIRNEKYEQFNNVYLDGGYIDVYESDNEITEIFPENRVGIKVRKLIIINWFRELKGDFWHVTKNEYYLKLIFRMIENTKYEIKKEFKSNNNDENNTSVESQINEENENRKIIHIISKKKYNKFGEVVEKTKEIIENENLEIILDIGDAIYLNVSGNYETNLKSGYIWNERKIKVIGSRESTNSEICSYGVIISYTLDYINRKLLRKERVKGEKPETFSFNTNN